MFVAFCFNLSQINDGDLVYDNGGGFINFPLNGTRPNGTVASYSCNSGFRLNALDSTRICETGIWTGFDLMCLAGKPWVHVYPFTGQIVVNITTTTERLLACQY